MTEKLCVEDIYLHFMTKTKDTTAAAILTLAQVLGEKERAAHTFDDTLGHEICMGIRHGLFNGNGDLGSSLSGIASALDPEGPLEDPEE